MGDYYTRHPERLQGQPKRTIVDYAEQYGILVPKRFDSIEEAVASQTEVLVRSEHTQDYDGVAGLLDSFELQETAHFVGDSASQKGFTAGEKRSLEEIKQAYFEHLLSVNAKPKFQQYCRYLGIDQEKFKKETSFSLWEKIPGFNRVIVADSAIAGRYHVMTTQDKMNFRNYVIFDNGKLIRHFGGSLPNSLRMGMETLIHIYEEIRHLDRFDSKHCPIMEFQTHRSKNYFVQYHRARDFSPTTFTIDPEQQHAVEVPFVRGATIPEGMACKVTLYYANMLTGEFDANHEDGSYDLHWHYVWPELRVRHRKVQMINTDNLDFTMESIVINHTQRSKLFKPQVSILHDINGILQNYKAYRNGHDNIYLNLQITSDGYRAFVKLLDINKN
jgi:glutathione peroxidase-family protein